MNTLLVSVTFVHECVAMLASLFKPLPSKDVSTIQDSMRSKVHLLLLDETDWLEENGNLVDHRAVKNPFLDGIASDRKHPQAPIQ